MTTGTDVAPSRPRLAADVTVHRPSADGAPWLMQRGRTRYFRVGADAAGLALALDGERGPDSLAAAMGAPWTASAVRTVLDAFHARGLLDDGTRRGPDRVRLVRFVPPLTVQFTLLRPDRLLDRIRPLVTAVTGRTGSATAGLLAAGGVLALAVQAGAVHRALGAPLSPGIAGAVLVAYFLANALHELGHAAVLASHGGRPSRMGVMLFYLTPAFFCDVTDGWRLPHKRQRVRVALAGIAVQAVLAGAAGIAGLVVAPGGTRDALLVFAVVQYVAGLINLVPFARFDGYFALMSHLDVPHLRDRAITDARRFLARVLFGGRYDRALDRRWSVPFGLACLLFPAYLLGTALVTWSGLLQRFGVAGAILLCCLLAYLAYLTVSGSVRLVREALRAGAALPRICAMTALAVAAFGTVLTWLPAPHTVSGGYVRHGDRFELVLPDGADRTAVRPGAHVRLQTAGLVTRSRTGTATVADARGTRTCAPAAAFVPVTLDPATCVPAIAYPLTVTEAPEAASGVATVDGGHVHLGRLLLDTLLAGWKW